MTYSKAEPDAQQPHQDPGKSEQQTVLVLRTPSGISGDMLVTGLARIANVSDDELESLVASIGIPALRNTLKILPHSVGGIAGWKAKITLPHEHVHRTLSAIEALINESDLAPTAAALARQSFQILAEAEARVHQIAPAMVHFHEVGALDSILDTCMAAALFQRIAPSRFVCSPLPLCDGVIHCAHGLIASPAPAVLEMLSGVPVYGIPSQGETVTPTALAFLKAAGASFGQWPHLTVQTSARAYGGRVLPGVPNGAVFTLGTAPKGKSLPGSVDFHDTIPGRTSSAAELAHIEQHGGF
jgi:uncharacterized protein (DUF111 family)